MPYKKYMFFILLTFIISLAIFSKTNAMINELPLLGRIVFVDPGHGGRDPGTMYKNLMEKDIVLDISLVLRDTLMEKGAIVYMTRDEDEDLSSRWDERKKRGDLYRRLLMYKDVPTEVYLSIHINNDNESSSYGAEVLYHPINKENERLAKILMKNFESDLRTSRVIKKTDLYMYRNTTIPGVLIECGFLSNSNERYLLQRESYQKKLANSITNSVIEFFN